MSNGDINSVCIAGRVTRDPEQPRVTSGGTSILSFGLVSNARRFNNQTQQWEDKPNFIDCKIIGKRAESLARILHKGMPVTVLGELSHSSWEKDGQKRSKLEVVADKVQLPPNPNRQQPAQAYQPAPAYQQHQAYQPAQAYPQQITFEPVQAQPEYETPVYEDEIPF